MADLDYNEIAATALGLVQEAGRVLTFRKLVTAPADSSKPWRGPTDPRSGATEASLPAVQVPISSAKELGLSTTDVDLIKSATVLLLVAPTPDFTDDLSLYSEVDVDGATYGFTSIDKLKPADVTLLYYGVATS